MTLVAARTWTTGELVTAALLNAQIRDVHNALIPGQVSYIIDGGGVVIDSGSLFDMGALYSNACISQWDVTADNPSSIQFGIVSVSYGGFPTSSSADDLINSGSYIQTASARKGQDTNPSAWGQITAGRHQTLYCIGASGVTRATISIKFTRQ